MDVPLVFGENKTAATNLSCWSSSSPSSKNNNRLLVFGFSFGDPELCMMGFSVATALYAIFLVSVK
jgi:hypothetical protein